MSTTPSTTGRTVGGAVLGLVAGLLWMTVCLVTAFVLWFGDHAPDAVSAAVAALAALPLLVALVLLLRNRRGGLARGLAVGLLLAVLAWGLFYLALITF